MNCDQQGLAHYLGHIVETIDRIKLYTEGSDELAFLENQLVQNAVICNSR